MSEATIIDLLEKMRNDESWCADSAKRNALANRLMFFIIEN